MVERQLPKLDTRVRFPSPALDVVAGQGITACRLAIEAGPKLPHRPQTDHICSKNAIVGLGRHDLVPAASLSPFHVTAYGQIRMPGEWNLDS